MGWRGPPWAAVGRRGLPWAAVGCRGPPWAAVGWRGPPWAAVGRRGLPWAAEGLPALAPVAAVFLLTCHVVFSLAFAKCRAVYESTLSPAQPPQFRRRLLAFGYSAESCADCAPVAPSSVALLLFSGAFFAVLHFFSKCSGGGNGGNGGRDLTGSGTRAGVAVCT